MGSDSSEEKQYAKEFAREQLRQLRDSRISEMKRSGETASGQPITGWQDSRTPIVGMKTDPVTGRALSGGSGLTSNMNWDAKFKSSFTGENPLAAYRPSAVANPVQQALSEAIPTLPSIQTMAQGGMNHAQKWMSQGAELSPGATITTPMGPAQDIFDKYGNQHSPALTRFITTGKANRDPFIGGANGKNVASDYVAGGRYSSYKPNSDSTLDRFSWASAFR